ncbi:hypothetical protein C1646_755548, partial [Rhizophagus diaphanus]
ISALKLIGNVHRLKIKKHYKYQSVRADISLLDEYEEQFERGTWKVQLVLGKSEKALLARWFPDKDQLDAAIALDQDKARPWIIHGKDLGNSTEDISKRDSSRVLVSTTPTNNKGKDKCLEDQPISTPTVIESVNLRKEINEEMNKEAMEDQSWIDTCRNGYKVLVLDLKEKKRLMDEIKEKQEKLDRREEEKKIHESFHTPKVTFTDTIDDRMVRKKVLNQWESEFLKNRKEHGDDSQPNGNPSVRPVTEEELRVKKVLNQWESEFLKNRKEHGDDSQPNGNPSVRPVTEEELRVFNDVNTRLMEKQGERKDVEDDEEDDNDSDGWVVSTSKKRGGKPGSYSKGRGGRRRHIHK